MRCRAMQALWKLALDPVGELGGPELVWVSAQTFDRRRHRVVFYYAGKAQASPEWILEGDISGCFDNFSHDWISNIYRWIRWSYRDGLRPDISMKAPCSRLGGYPARGDYLAGDREYGFGWA